ncbi:hypothetical protein ANCCAN_04223 [Ancylostoma caninum]|uniref:Core-2/I-Branching enzyme n=1 Tax=Ancylostoma caninum TaxID=29170 RepID=A0A368GZJ0_ANCCA|nr:hypothetical protein ANCCAN_04223 [Ancylostoma caninum]
MRQSIKADFALLLCLTTAFICVVNCDIGFNRKSAIPLMMRKSNFTLNKKWIVVTSTNLPTEDIKRLANISGWELVVVGDTKTPKTWSWKGVHFLGVEDQQRLGLGLGQFDYTKAISGLRYGCNHVKKNLSSKLFNPYRFFGNDYMWPRGFPLSYLQSHTNGPDRYCLCHKMRAAAVQQGLVHKDPDVDAIYRLLHADKQTGLNEAFNKMAPSVVLEKGIYAPWNSQNTLFNRKAFFILYLPVTVAFRVTDIWRSYFAQKLLHMIGENIAFYPVNAIQIRNAHNYLSDFESERDVYLKTEKIIEFLDEWRCSHKEISECTILLAEEFRKRDFWGVTDAKLVRDWIYDLRTIGYQFPPRTKGTEYSIQEQIRGANCRRADFEFDTGREDTMIQKSSQKLKLFGELTDWCAKANFPEFLQKLLSPSQLATSHTNNLVLANLRKSVLVITGNYPWDRTIGLLQRMYQPYFGLTIFCGSWFPDQYDDDNEAIAENFPRMLHPFNYIHLTEAEMNKGYAAYYCMSKVKDLRLGNVLGYYVMADDTTFNFWHGVNPFLVMHPIGDRHRNRGIWWTAPVGMKAALTANKLFTEVYKFDPSVQTIWHQFERGVSV